MATKKRGRGAGEGSIFKRNDGRWAGTISLGWRDGRRVRKSYYGATQAEVIDKIAEAKANLKRGLPLDAPKTPPPTPDAPTLGGFLADFLQNTVRLQVKPRSYEASLIIARRHILPLLGHIALKEVNRQHVAGLIAAKVEEGLAPLTVRHIRGFLKQGLSWALQADLIEKNPAVHVALPRLAQRRATFLTPVEARRLLDAAQVNRLAALYAVAIHLGLRKGEILGLRWRDVSFEAGTIRVTQTIQRVSRRAGGSGGMAADTPKTESSQRSVHMPEEVITALRSHRAAQARERLAAGSLWRNNDLAFTTLIGNPIDPSRLHEQFKNLLTKAGLPGDMHFHDLRHTTASLLLHGGASLAAIKDLLGHSSIKTTADIYARAYPADRRELANTMTAILGAKSSRS